MNKIHFYSYYEYEKELSFFSHTKQESYSRLIKPFVLVAIIRRRRIITTASMIVKFHFCFAKMELDKGKKGFAFLSLTK